MNSLGNKKNLNLQKFKGEQYIFGSITILCEEYCHHLRHDVLNQMTLHDK